MNEQIYLLTKQADTLAREIEPDLREIVGYNRIRDEQFFELCIKECVHTLINNGYDDAANCLQEEHLGVKE